MRAAKRSLLPAGLPFGWRGVGLVLAAVLVLSLVLEPAWVGRQPTVCVVRTVTGVPCPGCGLTRSFVTTAHGDLTGAFAFHPFGPVLFTLSVLALLAILWHAVTGRRPVGAGVVDRLRPAAWAFLAIWLLWAAGRAVLVESTRQDADAAATAVRFLPDPPRRGG